MLSGLCGTFSLTPDLSFSALQKWTDTTTRFTCTTAGWSSSSARTRQKLRTTNRPSSTGNSTRSAPHCWQNLTELLALKWFQKQLSSMCLTGMWQRVASLCVECRGPQRGALCGWNYVRAIPGYRGLPTAHLQNRNSTYHRGLLAG